MVDILAAVLTAGLRAVEAACAAFDEIMAEAKSQGRMMAEPCASQPRRDLVRRIRDQRLPA
jgi:hypothetical protein